MVLCSIVNRTSLIDCFHDRQVIVTSTQQTFFVLVKRCAKISQVNLLTSDIDFSIGLFCRDYYQLYLTLYTRYLVTLFILSLCIHVSACKIVSVASLRLVSPIAVTDDGVTFFLTSLKKLTTFLAIVSSPLPPSPPSSVCPVFSGNSAAKN